MKKKIKETMLMACLIGGIIGAFAGVITTVIQLSKDRRSPLYYCISEIHKHENYDCEFTYVYQELEPKSSIQKEATKGCDLYAYYITVFTDDRKGEWCCFIECKSTIAFNGYKPEEIVLIDCDIAIETLYGEYVYEKTN